MQPGSNTRRQLGIDLKEHGAESGRPTLFAPSPVKRGYRYVWSAAELQAKNEEWQLVCANVFGL